MSRSAIGMRLATSCPDELPAASYVTGGGSGEERLIETVTLNFATVKVEYTPQTEKGGKGTANSFSYDIAANTKV